MLILLAGSGGAAVSQPLVSVGAKGGVTLIAPAEHGDESKRYIVGPSIEVRLPLRFAVEFDALYQRTGVTAVFGGGTIPSVGPLPLFTNRQRSNQWEFPLIGKFYFRPESRKWQPYLGAGWVGRVGWQTAQGQSFLVGENGVQVYNFDVSQRSEFEIGAAAAAGIRWRAGRFAFSPEIRYQRWSQQGTLTRRNEANLMLGISF